MFKVILNYVIFMLISNKPIKVEHVQKLANHLLLNGAFVTEMVKKNFGESK